MNSYVYTKYSEQNGINVYTIPVNRLLCTTVMNGINAYHNIDEERPSL